MGPRRRPRFFRSGEEPHRARGMERLAGPGAKSCAPMVSGVKAGCGSDARSHLNLNLRSVNVLVVKRGDIYYADLSPVVGSEQGGVRPVLIIQNDIGNRYSPTVIATAITSQINKAKMPTHIEIDAGGFGLSRDSVVLAEQIRTIDKRRLKEKIGHLDENLMDKVNEALEISFGLT